ncbi:MAG: AraC family transcriptional regulator [Caulobacteraceae bacterium]
MITAQNLELTGCRLFESRDLEDTRARISAVMQPHRLQPVGTRSRQGVRAYMDFVDIAGLGLGAIKLGQMRVIAEQLENYHLLVFCRRGTGVLHLGDRDLPLDHLRGACLSPGSPLDLETSEDCEQFVVRIGEGLFRKHTGLSQPLLQESLDLSRPELQSWLRVLWSIAGNPHLGRENLKIAADYQRLLLSLLIQVASPRIDAALTIAPHSVRRAEAFIRQNAAHPICLDDIAKAADVPARTLLSGFRRFRETSPMTYLRDVRLDRVRHRLRMGVGSVSVTTVALEEGFGHLGRFSHEYAERFGEKPSDTLRAYRHA